MSPWKQPSRRRSSMGYAGLLRRRLHLILSASCSLTPVPLQAKLSLFPFLASQVNPIF